MKKYRLGVLNPHRIGRWDYVLHFDGSVSLRAYHGARAELIIPDTLMGRPVTSIGRGFIGVESMRTVVIPDTVKSIGKHAFTHMEMQTDVWIPASVTMIDETAFEDCGDICIHTPAGSCAQAFAIAHNITCRTDVIPACGAENADNIVSGDWIYALTEDDQALLLEYNGTAATLTIPAIIDGHTVHDVMGSCLYGNDFLEEVTVEEGVDGIGHFAFAECPSLHCVRLPQSLTFLGGGVFSGCRDLAEINLPPALSMLHMSTFSSCTSLRSITLPEKMRIICPMAFGSCTALEEIHLNPNLQTVPKSAFWKCPRLRKPDVLPETLDEEGRQTFAALQG